MAPAAACGAAWVWEVQDTVNQSCAERTLCSCIKVRIMYFNIDIQSVSAVPCTGLKVRLPSFQGAQQLTDLGMAFGTRCTVPIYLRPPAVTPSDWNWARRSPWVPGRRPQIIQVANPGCKDTWTLGVMGHTSGVSDNSKGSEEITPDFVFVTQANSRVCQHLWRQQLSVFQREANECDLHNQ